MRKLIFYVKTNVVGSKVKEEQEFEDNVTDEEIEKAYEEWLWNNIDSGWYNNEE